MKNAMRKPTGSIRNLGQWRPIEDADPEAWVIVPSDGSPGNVTIMRAGIARMDWGKKIFVPLPIPPAV